MVFLQFFVTCSFIPRSLTVSYFYYLGNIIRCFCKCTVYYLICGIFETPAANYKLSFELYFWIGYLSILTLNILIVFEL